MLVIATSVPDEREWIQWKGRTARQDRPGQFYVILNTKAKPFTDKKDLVGKVRKAVYTTGEKKGEPDHDARVELLLDCADEGIGDKLIAFQAEQATGEKLNELAMKYYKQNPRSFDAPWPSELESDKKLRHLMMTLADAKPDEIRRAAKDVLGIELD